MDGVTLNVPSKKKKTQYSKATSKYEIKVTTSFSCEVIVYKSFQLACQIKFKINDLPAFKCSR